MPLQVDRKSNLNSARVYLYQGEEECNNNMDTFIDCIDATKGTANNNMNTFIDCIDATKATALHYGVREPEMG